MAYVVDRVVICDAFREPDAHYGGRSMRVEGRNPTTMAAGATPGQRSPLRIQRAR
jgi:hypothetical protein